MLTMQDNRGNVVVEVFDDRYDKQMRHVSTHLRASDFDEVFAATGDSPHIEVADSWELSSRRFMIFNKRAQPVAVLGVRPLEAFSRIGIIWLLGTDGLGNMKKFFLRISKPIIKYLMDGYDVVFNYVDNRYLGALRWMEWCGFTVHAPEPFGALKLPFNQCTMERV